MHDRMRTETTPRPLSLGIGLTNACNLSCSHCYRPKDGIRHLDLDDVQAVLAPLEVASVNLGTGENILNPALLPVLDALGGRDVEASLTSNGLSLLELDEERLVRLADVEVSIDFADAAAMDRFRGEGAWKRAVDAARRCVGLGLEVTVLAVMMRDNHDRLAPIARLASDLGASFRVNVYQPVHRAEPMPTWEELWEGFRRLFAETELITCTEPVVVAALAAGEGGGLPRRTNGCGRTSVRLTPGAELLPCVYWPRPAATLAELAALGQEGLLETVEFHDSRHVPGACRDCPLLEACGGGCASRRALTVGVGERDPYCPMRDGEPVPLAATPGPDLELLHAANVCTTIVRAP